MKLNGSMNWQTKIKAYILKRRWAYSDEQISEILNVRVEIIEPAVVMVEGYNERYNKTGDTLDLILIQNELSESGYGPSPGKIINATMYGTSSGEVEKAKSRLLDVEGVPTDVK